MQEVDLQTIEHYQNEKPKPMHEIIELKNNTNNITLRFQQVNPRNSSTIIKKKFMIRSSRIRKISPCIGINTSKKNRTFIRTNFERHTMVF